MAQIYKQIPLTGKTQADGATGFDISTQQAAGCFNHLFQVVLSALPSAGVLQVDAKIQGAPSFSKYGELSLTADGETGLFYPMSGYFSAIRFTPVGFDSDKSYSIYMVSGG